MNANRDARYCRCGTRLARDSPGRLCSACQAGARDLLMRPPEVPAEFWSVEQMRDALASWHMGRVIAAYRHHSFHGQTLRQEVVGRWVGLTQAQVSRIENGPPIKDLDRLTQWARVLRIPTHLLWFQLADQIGQQAAQPPAVAEGIDISFAGSHPFGAGEVDDMNRRELLRILTMAGSGIATHRFDQLDLDRMNYAGERPSRIDHATIDQHDALNTQLWTAFSSATSKSAVLPLVQRQLRVLTTGLQASHAGAIRRRLYAVAAGLFQLAGEILFDADRYAEAAHCYTLAVTASQEANAFDLWACALTRHAFIDVYERLFTHAAPMIELAATIARRGDRTLSTRHWVHAVHAQALAGLGDLDGCQRALDTAEEVLNLSGRIHNGGWLRFDGARLPEERGACYVELRRPDLAEPVLLSALGQDLSLRRRGGVLTDLAMVGVQRREPDQTVMYANAALDIARHTHSGVVGTRLVHLRQHLLPLQADGHVRHLSRQIAALTTSSSVA